MRRTNSSALAFPATPTIPHITVTEDLHYAAHLRSGLPGPHTGGGSILPPRSPATPENFDRLTMLKGIIPAPYVGRYHWVAWVVAAVALVVAAAFLAVWRGRAPASENVVNFFVYPPEKTAFSSALNTTLNVPQFALSPDGRAIVLVAESPGARPMLWLRSLEQVSARTLPGTEDAAEQRF